MPIEVIYADRPSQVVTAKVEGDNLWLGAAELAKVSGWELKPEGVCKDGICVPIPVAREADFVRDNRQSFNLVSFARLMGQPILHDAKSELWYFGENAENRMAALKSLEAPDFELPDLDGKMHRLSDYRGKKVLLSAWASW
jgi:AhpC/TSA family